MTELRRVTWEKKMKKKEEEKMMTNKERWRGKRKERREGGRAGGGEVPCLAFLDLAHFPPSNLTQISWYI